MGAWVLPVGHAGSGMAAFHRVSHPDDSNCRTEADVFVLAENDVVGCFKVAHKGTSLSENPYFDDGLRRISNHRFKVRLVN